jgi:hypothetical protein
LNKAFLIFFGICFYWGMSFAQLPKVYHGDSGWGSSFPRTNTINDVLVRQDTVWVGTESGLSFTVNGGASWTHFSGTGTFDDKGISAIAIAGNSICVATGFSTKLNGESVQTGGGLHYSVDLGQTWSFIPQPLDKNPLDSLAKRTIDTLTYGSNKIRALAIVVPQQNITFDIALTKNTIWIASWAGGLRKSTDLGKTWTRVILPPDNLDSIDPAMPLNYAFALSPGEKIFTVNGKQDTLAESDNHKLFSVYASDDSTIWAGTAGGINKSIDGGVSWRKFSHQNQIHSISGNFVVALNEQRWKNRRIMWAATVNANDPDETKGVSFSDDGGETWKTALLGEWAHNIAVRDSIVYVATDAGLFRSSDFGESWIRNGSIYDPANLQRFFSTECYGVGPQGNTVWFGGPEGIAYTVDSPFQQFGTAWRIFRTAEQVGSEKRTYSFPNPFAPPHEPARLHYSVSTGYSGTQDVSIRIFDYAMLPVRTLIQKASRQNGKEYDEIWDGMNDNRSLVTNGVYFYRVEIGDQSPLWGKILVLR